MAKGKKPNVQAATARSMPGSSVLASMDIDGEIAQQLNRLSRKNRAAKMKALAALSQIIRQKPAKETVKMMHQWAFVYKKLSLDYNREVRLGAHGTLTNIIIALRQDLNPYIKTLIGPWWFSQFDPEPQVSQAAKSSFETAFPASEKRLLALTLCSTEILTYIEENLKRTPQSLSDVAIATEELERMHQQVLSSSLLALAALLDVLPFRNYAKSTSSDTVEIMPAVEKLFTSHNYFTGFFKSQSPVVRTAAYSVVKSCIKLSMSHAFDKGEFMQLVFPAMLGSFQEKNSDCHSSMWEALLLFMKTFPESWNTVNVPKSVLNPLWDFLKNGCFGSQKESYPALVTFLDTLPPHNSITGDTFFLEFFRKLWEGRKLACSSDAADRRAFFSAIKECFDWALRYAYSYCDGVDVMFRFKRLLVDEILIGLIWHEYHQIVSSAYNSSLLSNEIPPTRARNYEENFGECIIKILSQLQRNLLGVVSLKFQADCSRKLHLKTDKDSQNVHWIVRFLLLLDQHAVQKGETWPFDLVRPTLKSFSVLSSPDSMQLLEVAVSIFGPRKILCEIACSSELAYDDLPCASFKDIVIPWCLKDYNDFKLDLLLEALLDNKESSFLEEWDAVINYLVDSAKACIINKAAMDEKYQVSVFASLMKKAREINRRQTTTKPVTVKCHYHVLDLMKKAWEMTRRKSSSAIKWHHDHLDLIAVFLVRARPPYEKSNAQFISAVLGGGLEDDKSFLSPCTQILILEEVRRKLLLFMMDSNFVWIRDLCSLLVNKMGNEESSCYNNSPDMAFFALDILGGSFFCLKNIEDENEELIDGILAAIFIIDWEFHSIINCEDECNEEQLEKASSRLASIRAAYALRCRVSDQLLKGFDANRRKSLGTMLIELAKRAVFIDNDAFLSDEFISTCCKWVLDIFRVFCVDQLEQQQLLDQLLSKNECWAAWITTDGEVMRTENVYPQRFKNANFMALIDKLLPKLGCDELVARPWLVAEFLCTWKWIGGSAFGSFLPSFIGYLNDKDASSEYFYHVIPMLFDGAIAHHGVDSHNHGLNHLFWLSSFEEIGTVEEPFLRALLSLLSTLFREKIWGEENALSLFEQLVNELNIGDTDVNSRLSILPYVMNILVGTQFLDEHARFQSATVEWLERAVSFPPINEWETGNDMEDWFKLIIACFPIKVTEGMLWKDDNKLEQSLVLLLELLRKQNVGCAPISVNGMLSSMQMLLLSKLMVISVAYCGVDLDTDDWIFILSYSRDWIDSAVVIMKEIAEIVHNNSMNDSVVDVAALSSRLKNDIVMNDCLTIVLNAVVVFSLPCKLGLYMEQDPSENTLVIERTEEFATDDVLEKYLCLFFYNAAAEALADSNGRHEEASSVIALFRFDHRRLWELVGSFVDKTTSRVRERAVKSMEKMGLSKDPIASLFALLSSCKPLPPLQSAALELLTTVPLVRSASTFDIGNINHNPSSTDGNVFVLRKEISRILERSPKVSEMNLLAHERVNVFVAWGLVLTFLTSQSSNSSVVARQRITDLMDPVVVLDCLFQHIPVEQSFSTSTKKYRKFGRAVSIAGKAAKRAIKEGSASFAIKSLWPVGHDSMASLSGAVFGLMLCSFPDYVRQWWSDVQDPYLSIDYELFIKSWCSKTLASAHVCGLEDGNLSISKATTDANRKVMAIYTKDDAAMELIISFPQTSYPLTPVAFHYGDGNLGIDWEKRYDWLDSLNSFVRNQNGTLKEAIKIWKSNIDKEFEGVEDCFICYSTFGEGDYQLPDVACITCKHKFHSKCIKKWLFSTYTYKSGWDYNPKRKNMCPMCKSSFYPHQSRIQGK